MSILVTKLIVCPIVLVIAWFVLPINFAYFYQPIILGVMLAVIGRLMEKIVLRKETMTISLILDFIASAAIVYFVTPFFIGGEVTVWAALIIALVLAITETPQHRWLVTEGYEEEAIA